jgi:hypothetical protein
MRLAFPNGGWTGFFLQWIVPGRSQMNLDLNFTAGLIEGRGRDWVGAFSIDGEYDAATGSCHWIKKYAGKHSVSYEGVNDGHGIRGVWEIRMFFGLYVDRGAFHIWPVGTTPSEEADITEKAMRAMGPKLYQQVPGFGLLVAIFVVILLVLLVIFAVNWANSGAMPWE